VVVLAAGDFKNDLHKRVKAFHTFFFEIRLSVKGKAVNVFIVFTRQKSVDSAAFFGRLF
jgi:hypothetical protein